MRNESLNRLQVDHVDLLQFHEVIRMEDPDRFFADDGALEAFLDAVLFPSNVMGWSLRSSCTR